jgi:hypothetical protein
MRSFLKGALIVVGLVSSAAPVRAFWWCHQPSYSSHTVVHSHGFAPVGVAPVGVHMMPGYSVGLMPATAYHIGAMPSYSVGAGVGYMPTTGYSPGYMPGYSPGYMPGYSPGYLTPYGGGTTSPGAAFGLGTGELQTILSIIAALEKIRPGSILPGTDTTGIADLKTQVTKQGQDIADIQSRLGKLSDKLDQKTTDIMGKIADLSTKVDTNQAVVLDKLKDLAAKTDIAKIQQTVDAIKAKTDKLKD